MAGISHIVNIARSGIRANQQGLATTSQNISNINTKGYSRQEVVLETASPANGQEASGVQVSEIRRNVDVFLEELRVFFNQDLLFCGLFESWHGDYFVVGPRNINFDN